MRHVALALVALALLSGCGRYDGFGGRDSGSSLYKIPQYSR